MPSQKISPHKQKITSQRNSPPQLLVSVRSLDEAIIAVAGGCDVLDIKEPHHGSLGKAETATINSIAEYQWHNSQSCNDIVPKISAAMGEVIDWEEPMPTEVLSHQLSYLKLGLSGLNDDNWLPRWLSVRDAIEKNIAPTSNSSPKWIAVAYADWKQATAPQPQEILEAAIATNCAGFLIDTFVKDGQSLLNHFSIEELFRLSAIANQHNILFAVAGSLNVNALPKLENVNPDIIAIRSAACRHGQRTNDICQKTIQQFQTLLTKSFLKNATP